MKIFDKITINGLKGMVIVADCFIEENDLKAELAIDFEVDIDETNIKKLIGENIPAIVTVKDFCGNKGVDVYADCDYANGSVARVFMVIENYEKTLRKINV